MDRLGFSETLENLREAGLWAIGADEDLTRCRWISVSLGHLRDYIALDAGTGMISPDEVLNEQRAWVRRWLGCHPKPLSGSIKQRSAYWQPARIVVVNRPK